MKIEIDKNQEENTSHEIKSKLTVRNGFGFGFGFGIGFFVANLLITIIAGFIIFIFFGAAITSFQKTITDPFGFKNTTYSQPTPIIQNSLIVETN